MLGMLMMPNHTILQKSVDERRENLEMQKITLSATATRNQKTEPDMITPITIFLLIPANGLAITTVRVTVNTALKKMDMVQLRGPISWSTVASHRGMDMNSLWIQNNASPARGISPIATNMSDTAMRMNIAVTSFFRSGK